MRAGVIVQFALRVPDGLVADGPVWAGVVGGRGMEDVARKAQNAYRNEHGSERCGGHLVVHIYWAEHDGISDSDLLEVVKRSVQSGCDLAQAMFGPRAALDGCVIFDTPS